MPQTPASPRTSLPVVTTQQQRIYVRQLALQIRACSEQILIDQARGRTVRGNGRKLVNLSLALCEAQAAMAAYEEAAARLARAA
jgi:hypothetical protein